MQGISTEVRNVLLDSFDDLLETLIVLAFSLARMCQEGTELMCLAMYKESCMVAETPFSPPKSQECPPSDDFLETLIVLAYSEHCDIFLDSLISDLEDDQSMSRIIMDPPKSQEFPLCYLS